MLRCATASEAVRNHTGLGLVLPDFGAALREANIHELFRRSANWAAAATGTPPAFLLGVGVILLWALSGPFLHFSVTWQLLINTATGVVTFLLVFLIRRTQQRDAKAFHLKLNELLRGVAGARTHLVNLERLTDEEIAAHKAQFARLREQESHRDRVPHS
jgi:low affinity Fe/Cu permease